LGALSYSLLLEAQAVGQLKAKRNDSIAPFYAMELMRRARELERSGKSIIHMELGEPDFPTPSPVVKAAQRFLENGIVHYTSAIGLPQLKEAIAKLYQTRHGVLIDPQQVAITAGGSSALTLLLSVLTNPESEWLMADPGYPCNRHIIRTFGGLDVALNVDRSTRFQPTLQQIKDKWNGKTAGVILVSPSNPTGSVLTKEEIQSFADFVKEKGGALIIDEVYHGLTYEESAATAAGMNSNTFVVQSFSKYFNMTGWRVGWIVAPHGYSALLEKMAQNLFIAPPTIGQHAALAALMPETIEILEARKLEFKERRDYLYSELLDIGFKIEGKPSGAFYVWADCRPFGRDSFQLANELLENCGVAVTPGLDFGSHFPEHHLRFAYATSLDQLKEGIGRIRQYLLKPIS
jgi:aspartate/methionine/tyrosine aminotransferase